MKTFEQDFKTNPSFNTVTGLTNTTFDPNNVVSGRGATEDQVKFVHDMIKALQDWLDENGCSDDPYAIIRQKIDEVEAAIDVCCANPQDTLIQMLTNRLNQLETDMNTCCQVMDDNAYQALVDRLDALEASINCDPCSGQGEDVGTCDGNKIIVSFQWTSANQTTGKATATSEDTTRAISSYWFLTGNKTAGVYYKKKIANAGNFHYKIDNSGNVTLESDGGYDMGQHFCLGIIAVDSQGCEGMLAMNLPTFNAPGG